MKEKINILFGIESSGGGAFKHIVYLATRLPKDKFCVTLVYSSNRNEDISSELEILRNHEVMLISLPMSQKINLIKDLDTVRFVLRLMKEKEYQVVHAHSSKAGLVFRLAGIIQRIPKIYFTPHCFHFQSKKGIVKKLSILYESFMSIVTTKIIVSDNEFKEALKFQIAKEDKFKIINNAISFEELKMEKTVKFLREEFKIPKQISFIVGGIGRLEPQKDWETFIKMANEVVIQAPDTFFLIVGEGSQKEFLKALIKKNKLFNNVCLTGHIKEIHKIYNIIDVLISTSLWEGLPYVVLEASQYNRPVISTKAISDEIPFIKSVCEYKDYRCLANEIIDLRRTEGDLKGRKNHIYLKKFSFKRFVSSHIQLYT